MIITYRFLNVMAALEHGSQPADVCKSEGGLWLVLDGQAPLGRDQGPLPTTQVLSGEVVRVPLWPFRTMSEEPAQVAALAAELGARMIEAVNFPIRRLHLALGTPVKTAQSPRAEADTGDLCYSFWMGLAVEVEQ
jgi:hypothetical protein